MQGFTHSGRVLCLLLWGNVLAFIGPLILAVHAAESSGSGETKAASSVPESGLGSFSPLSLAAKFPDELEVTDYCLKLLQVFGQRNVALVNCLVSSARPVKVCQNCYGAYNSFNETYANITLSSDKFGPENVSCQDSLMRSDRLMLLYNLYSSFNEIWVSADCTSCLTPDYMSLSNRTLFFLANLNTTLSCFEKYQGNHSELCSNCRELYKHLNDLYSAMQKNLSLCIDLEDAMNVTRHLWSKNFSCSVPREETVPVIAVSSFMLFLPVIFYLSNFLHSEQKKRKLIHPKRAKSNHSLMNIQDKFS